MNKQATADRFAAISAQDRVVLEEGLETAARYVDGARRDAYRALAKEAAPPADGETATNAPDPIYVVCVRDPDAENAYTVMPNGAPVTIVDLDMGRGDNDSERAQAMRETTRDMPKDVRALVEETIRDYDMDSRPFDPGYELDFFSSLAGEDANGLRVRRYSGQRVIVLHLVGEDRNDPDNEYLYGVRAEDGTTFEAWHSELNGSLANPDSHYGPED